MPRRRCFVAYLLAFLGVFVRNVDHGSWFCSIFFSTELKWVDYSTTSVFVGFFVGFYDPLLEYDYFNRCTHAFLHQALMVRIL